MAAGLGKELPSPSQAWQRTEVGWAVGVTLTGKPCVLKPVVSRPPPGAVVEERKHALRGRWWVRNNEERALRSQEKQSNRR